MEKIVEERTKALEIMKGVKTWEDLKEHKEEILSHMEESLKYSLDSLREIIKLTETSEDLQKEFTEFEEGLEVLSDELDSEGFRIEDIPGVKENLGSFQEEMETRLEPYIQELEKLGEELMKIFEGKFMEGFGGIFEDIAKLDDEKGE